jgi:uncharacterized membrane protein YdfJ with MMPL/SSD domain
MENQIKELILRELKVDITETCRKREIIEGRALYFYLVRKLYKKRSLQSIASDFEMNHATVVHSLKNFQVYETYNPKILDCKNLILKLLGGEVEQELSQEDIFKKKLHDLEKQLNAPRYEYKIIENLNNLLEATKGTEQHELITLRLEAFYSMNKNIRL